MIEDRLSEIFDSYTNGQRKQMTNEIDAYGIEFWRHFSSYLENTFPSIKWSVFVCVVNSYHLIKGY